MAIRLAAQAQEILRRSKAVVTQWIGKGSERPKAEELAGRQSIP